MRLTYTDLTESKTTKVWEREQTHGMKAVGAFALPGVNAYFFIYPLDEYDEKEFSYIKLGKNEKLFRYETETSKIGGFIPVFKMNMESGLVYFADDLYADELTFPRISDKPIWVDINITQKSQINITQCPLNVESYNIITLDISYKIYASKKNRQVCAFDGDTLVGVSIFSMKEGIVYMKYSTVIESHRNRGINKKMKLEIIKIAKENNCTKALANVREKNINSLKSLKSIGFVETGNIPLYKNGDKKIELIKNI